MSPEISRLLAGAFDALGLGPVARERFLRLVPPGAETVAALPVDVRALVDASALLAALPTVQIGPFRYALELTAAVGVPADVGLTPGDPADVAEGDPRAGLPETWSGRLVPYDVAAPDGRTIGAPPNGGDPKSREMPLPFKAQFLTDDGHKSSALIGIVTRVWTQDGALWGEGRFDLDTEVGRYWAGKVMRGMAPWGSVDLDPGDVAPVESVSPEGKELTTYPDWGFGGFTLVADSAFDGARIEAPGPAAADAGTDLAQQHDPGSIHHPNSYAVPPEVEAMLTEFTAPAEAVAPVEGIDAGMGGGGLPLAPADTPWDATEALARVAEWAGDDPAKYGKAFAVCDTPEGADAAVAVAGPPVEVPPPGDGEGEGAPPFDPGAYRFQFADVVDGELAAVPKGVHSAALDVVAAGLDGDDLEQAKGKLGGYLEEMGEPAPWGEEEPVDAPDASVDFGKGEAARECDAEVAALCASLLNTVVHVGADRTMSGEVVGFDSRGWVRVAVGEGTELVCSVHDVEGPAALTAAAAMLAAPPDAWFEDPHFDGPTRLQVTDDGRVFGHLAAWDVCHVGFADTCVQAPRTKTDYSYFRTGEAVVASGGRVAVGKITLGTGHASPGAGWQAAAAHYDNTGSTVAIVASGEDSHGIWVAGALLPECTPAQVAALRRSPLSGDWRRMGGNLELVAALAVNSPGFPIPRPRAGQRNFRQASLVAAGVVVEPEAEPLGVNLTQVVGDAVENALESYADRRNRAGRALSLIAGSNPKPAAGCGGKCACQAAGPQ